MKIKRPTAGRACCAGLVVTLLLAGCASTTPAPVTRGRTQLPPPAATTMSLPTSAPTTYTVKRGDTLYSIAREHGMDYRELIALNNIENPARVAEGVVLKIRPPSAVSSAVATTSPITTDVVVSRPIDEPTLETRPLSAAPGMPAPGNSETFKREPKGGKVPYSEQALALAQGGTRPTEPVAAPSAAPSPAPALPAAPSVAPKVEDKPEARVDDWPPAGGDEIAWIWPASGRTIATFNDGGSKGVDIAGNKGDPVIAAGDGKVVYSGTGLRGYGKLVIIKHNNTYLSAYAHNQAILVKEGQNVSKGQKIAEMGNTDTDQVKLHFEVRRQGKPVDPLKYLPQR